MNILTRAFYARDTVEVARNLLGKRLLRRIGSNIVVGVISECEAYRSDDPACHAYAGKTKRTMPLFGEVGHTYVYFSYGLHYCLNVVARNQAQFAAGGVLLRGVFPVEGIELMQTLRRVQDLRLLTNGPGKLAQAFNITLDDRGIDVTNILSTLVIEDAPEIADHHVKATSRIGISRATDKLWRFVLAKNVPLLAK